MAHKRQSRVVRTSLVLAVLLGLAACSKTVDTDSTTSPTAAEVATAAEFTKTHPIADYAKRPGSSTTWTLGVIVKITIKTDDGDVKTGDILIAQADGKTAKIQLGELDFSDFAQKQYAIGDYIAWKRERPNNPLELIAKNAVPGIDGVDPPPSPTPSP